MSRRIGETIDEGFKKFKPRKRFEIIKTGEPQNKFVKHKILNY